jgi:hypothetical protein
MYCAGVPEHVALHRCIATKKAKPGTPWNVPSGMWVDLLFELIEVVATLVEIVLHFVSPRDNR